MVDPASIRNASFTLTPTGYNPEEVDRYLGELADDLGAADPGDVRNASFSLTPTGYNPEEVDEYLSQVADALAAGPVEQAVETCRRPLRSRGRRGAGRSSSRSRRGAGGAEEPVARPSDHGDVEPEIVAEASDRSPCRTPSRRSSTTSSPRAEARADLRQAVQAPEPAPVFEEPVTVLPEGDASGRPQDVPGSRVGIEDAIARSRRRGQRAAELRKASELEIGDIHRERQRLIDEAADAGRGTWTRCGPMPIG